MTFNTPNFNEESKQENFNNNFNSNFPNSTFYNSNNNNYNENNNNTIESNNTNTINTENDYNNNNNFVNVYKNPVEEMPQIEYLKTQIRCLIKEKEILMKEKENNIKEILHYREMIQEQPELCNLINKKSFEKRQNEMVKLYKNKENNYINEIMCLHRIIIERENEIENIKNNYMNIINNLKIDNENLYNKLKEFHQHKII